jgi:hypothetical protein
MSSGVECEPADNGVTTEAEECPPLLNLLPENG